VAGRRRNIELAVTLLGVKTTSKSGVYSAARPARPTEHRMDPMRKLLLAIAMSGAISGLSIWAVTPAAAEQAKQTHTVQSGKQHGKKPAKLTRPQRSCAEYGAGFVRAADSDTCVKVGGSISVEVGR
jgi:hypothetical protein